MKLSRVTARRSLHAAALMTGLALPLVSMTGCVGYGSWPPVEGADLAATNPNVPYTVETTTLALQWVLQRYPVPGAGTSPVGLDEPRFAVNLPAGLRRGNYIRIASAAGGTPVTPDNAGELPVFHIGRVWIRGGTAKVDVLRPMFELPRRADGSYVYQCVTVLMEGGFRPWGVTGTQTREPGLVPVPDLYYLPATEFPEQEARIQRARAAEIERQDRLRRERMAPEPVAAPEPEPILEPTPEPVLEPVPEPAPEPTPEPPASEVLPASPDAPPAAPPAEGNWQPFPPRA